MSIAAAREAWAQERIARISGFIPVSRCEGWCGAMADAIARREIEHKVYETPKDPAILNEGGLFDHYILDGYRIAALLPDMVGAYEATRLIVAEVTQLDVVLSPYPRSAVNINRYDAPGGQMSAHYDSNPISVMVYLTSNEGNGATVFHRPGMPDRIEYPRAGDVLIFDGRTILHESALVVRGIKAVAVWNFYTEQDQTRPAGMDEFMYGRVA